MPAPTTNAHPAIEIKEPDIPTSINGLRPNRSDARAQNGAQTEKSMPDRDKIVATSGSGIPISRPIVGMTDARPVRPMVVIMDVEKIRLNDRGDRPHEAVALFNIVGVVDSAMDVSLSLALCQFANRSD
jgi:hypothetical protein